MAQPNSQPQYDENNGPFKAAQEEMIEVGGQSQNDPNRVATDDHARAPENSESDVDHPKDDPFKTPIDNFADGT